MINCKQIVKNTKRFLKFNKKLVITQKSSLFGRANSGSEGYDVPPLSEPLDNLHKIKHTLISSEAYTTQVTKLESGVRVASEKLYGDFCTVGVLIDSGPRYEKQFTNGITHFLEKLAFSSTSSYENRDDVLNLLEKNGAVSDCQSGRDAIIYALSCKRSGLAEIVNLLGETIYRPIIKDSELDAVRQAIEFEIEDLNMRIDPEQVLQDMIHAAAYGQQTLGNPKLCPLQNIPQINSKSIYSYMNTLYKPERMVIACVGAEHNEFVNIVSENFNVKKPIWLENIEQIEDINLTRENAKWQGGQCIIERDLSVLCQGQNQLPELAHLVVGLESPAYTEEKDFVAACVLNMLMGGGGSFSAGGPGKGMYSRLYTNVLNRFHFMFSATALNQSYADSGLFCINASSPPANVQDMCLVIGKELMRMRGPCDRVELARAKKQLQSMLFMNLEQRPVQFEDVVRQVNSRNRREKAQYYFDRIEAIQEADVQRVANRMLASAPAVAALGRLESFNPYERMLQIFNGNQSRFKERFFGV